MPNCALIIGGAGSGKTHRLLEIMDRIIERGKGSIGPLDIGFISFTKAARREAAERAAERLDSSVHDLEQHGWFRTLHCSPPNEPILTVNRGYVPISELRPKNDRLVSYVRQKDRILSGGAGINKRHASLSGFSITSRQHMGRVLTIHTDSSTTTVTSDHRVSVRIAYKPKKPFFVYLMRRGDWWRIGMVSPRKRYSSGLDGRMCTEKADAAWVLACYSTKKGATAGEWFFQGKYGIPSCTFEAHSGSSVSNRTLHELHDSLKDTIQKRVIELANETGIDLNWPVFKREKGKKYPRLRTFETVAANLVPDLMVFPVFIRGQTKPAWQNFTVETALYGGTVFGLDVQPHEHYISGGAVVHNSCCYRLLGTRKESLVADSKADRKWLQDALQEDVRGVGDSSHDDDPYGFFDVHTLADTTLQIWRTARNRLVPFIDVWKRQQACDERTPDIEFCQRIVERYEQAKRLDGRCDFADLLGAYAGWSFRFDGHYRCEPDGDVPKIGAWFLDEAQDQSKLIDEVARRLTSRARFVYLVGDPFQAIFSWAGADAGLFQSWPHQKKDILRQTYRCPAPILELGESCIRDCSDYWDRGMLPAAHDGEVEKIDYQESWQDLIDPRKNWLLLARTNFVANRISKRLDSIGVPWLTMRGGGWWNAPVRHRAIRAMMSLRNGKQIDGHDWRMICEKCPSQAEGTPLLKRGTKTLWKDYSGEMPMSCSLDSVSAWGAAPAFIAAIKNGKWTRLLEGAEDYLDAVNRWGEDAVRTPLVRVSTIHGAKGAEADNVLFLTTTSHQVSRTTEFPDGANEESRIAYVAVTRARRRLIVATEKTEHKMEI